MKLRFKAFSMKNWDFQYVLEIGRLRGCPKGDPMLVFGYDIQESEYNLDIIREVFERNPNAELKENKRGSFTVIMRES